MALKKGLGIKVAEAIQIIYPEINGGFVYWRHLGIILLKDWFGQIQNTRNQIGKRLRMKWLGTGNKKK
jgi:hypothetical protein